jgi:Tol biopolymer transport system component
VVAETSAQPVWFSSIRGGVSAPQIYRMDSNGVIRLTVAGTNDQHPTVNRAKTLVAFQSVYSQLYATWHIDVMNANGSNRHTVVQSSTANYEEPALSPDGTKIAFTRFAGNDAQVYLVNVDGTGFRQLSWGGYGEGLNYQPTWSPDGSKIAFVSVRHGFQDIYSVPWTASTTANATRLTYRQSGIAHPTYSPDGRNIAYTVTKPNSSESEIWFSSAVSANVETRVASTFDSREPSWCPDGKTILYTKYLNGQSYLVAGDTSGVDRGPIITHTGSNFDGNCGYKPAPIVYDRAATTSDASKF